MNVDAVANMAAAALVGPSGTLMIVTKADLIAIHRTHEVGGRDTAVAELRPLWSGITKRTTPERQHQT